MPSRRLRVAVVGAGPAGLYTAEALTTQDQIPVSVAVMDKLPTPFGLVRYGVAPDHHSIRSVRDTLAVVLSSPHARFLGNIAVGEELPVADLRSVVDAVVYTYGAAAERLLGIPGEDLPGSVAAGEMVAWYCGHPDAPRTAIEAALAGVRTAVVVGAGNVALDIVRVLLKGGDGLIDTDMPQHVLDGLNATAITDVHLLIRRGPAQAAWTTKELRELGAMTDVDVLVDERDMELDEASAQLLAANRLLKRNYDTVLEWSKREPQSRPKRLHLHFLTKPVALLGDGQLRSVQVERTKLDASGGARGTGEFATIDADVLVRSVGYRGSALPGVPLDSDRGVVPNEAGRVLRDGAVSPGEYVAGWIKRGPTGVIGTNKSDAYATAASLLADAPALLSAPAPADEDLDQLLELIRKAGLRAVDIHGWGAINAAEIALGQSLGRHRITVHERAMLLELAIAAIEGD